MGRPLQPSLALGLLCLAAAVALDQALAAPAIRRNTSASTTAARRAPTEISSSVIITGFYDFDGNIGNGKSPCEAAAENAKGYNARKLNFVITLSAVGSENKLNRYYYKDTSGNMVPADDGTISRFKAGLEKCFRAGLNAGFTALHVLPHVDPIQEDGRGLWRNVVRFDPVMKYGPDSWNAYSYEQVLLQPAAEAINAVVDYNTAVEFTLSAEQGKSVWSYPRAYIEVLQRVKEIATRGKNPHKHTFGVSFNYDKVCGCVQPEERDPIKYNNTYLQRFENFKADRGLKKIDVEGVKQLFDETDFIGISSYAPLPAKLTRASMEVSIQTVAFEMQPFGIDLKSYIFGSNKSLIYSEQGLGGCKENRQVAPDLNFVRIHPFWGSWPTGGYTAAVDPWKIDAFRAYRQRLYQLLASWASQGGGPQYKIDGIFLWSVGTWDVQGIHPQAVGNAEGTYADSVIQNYIRQANAVANLPIPAHRATQSTTTNTSKVKAGAPASIVVESTSGSP